MRAVTMQIEPAQAHALRLPRAAPVISCVPSRAAAQVASSVPAPAVASQGVQHNIHACVGGLSHQPHAERRRFRCQAVQRPSVFLFGFGGQDDDDYDEAYTVMKLQVGIFGNITGWQQKFERLSNLFDTDEEGGLHAIMQETLQTLLRNTEYVSYATSGGRVYNYLDEAEAKFNEVSFEERAKFKEETLTNVDGRTQKHRSSTRTTGDKDLDQWMCLTLIFAVERSIKLPKIQSVWDLKQAIKVLGGITVDELLAFEMMWTPEDEGDSYSKEELLADYPAMATLT